MQRWFETVRFHREMFCEKCRTQLVRRAGVSPVINAQGEWIEAWPAGVDDYDPRADYLVRCECGHHFEIQSTEDVQQLNAPEGVVVTGPPVLKLT
jgi:hypothetical protein